MDGPFDQFTAWLKANELDLDTVIDKLKRYARCRHHCDGDESENVTQEVLLRAATRFLTERPPPDQAIAFLKKIADHYLYETWRKGSRIAPNPIDPDPIDPKPPKIEEPWSMGLLTECRQLMFTSEQWALFLEYETGETPKAELASRMQIREGALAVRMLKQRRKLASCIECMNLRLSSDQRRLLSIFRSDPKAAAYFPAAEGAPNVETFVERLRKIVESCVSLKMSTLAPKVKVNEKEEGGQ